MARSQRVPSPFLSFGSDRRSPGTPFLIDQARGDTVPPLKNGIFDYLSAQVLRLVRGDGCLLLVSIVVLTAPICAILPNATVLILFAPLLIRVCRTMGIDFAPPIMLLVFVANASGLLTRPIHSPLRRRNVYRYQALS
jgi:hypothetical protein